jgi:hypothetical protein
MIKVNGKTKISASDRSTCKINSSKILATVLKTKRSVIVK